MNRARIGHFRDVVTVSHPHPADLAPMLKPANDDYFNKSTMTFGEHLDELRGSLVKAILAVAIGTGIGLFFGDDVVRVITAPLQNALTDYYKEKVVEDYAKWLEDEDHAAQAPMPIKGAEALVNQRDLLFEIAMVPVVPSGATPVSDDPVVNRLREDLKKLSAEVSELQETIRRMQGKSGNDPNPPKDHSETKQVDPSKEETGASGEIPDAELPPVEAADEEIPELKAELRWHRIEDDPRISPATLSAQEAFMIWFKASILIGLTLSAPAVFFFIWQFVAAGLYPHEKRYVYIFLPFSIFLFIAGACVAYFMVFQPVLNFLFSFNKWLGLHPDLRISEWLGLVLFMPLGFGVSFQLPLVMFFLERITLFSVESYVKKWRIAVMAITVISAVLTPADPYSIFFMAVPLVGLYFFGILLCKYMPKNRRQHVT